ncbi:MAG: helix-turn-helix transcriptional regulator [Clostridia bacterium]|nr:helix-turn-helix transcriptional regulator [Clostridia bacterium]
MNFAIRLRELREEKQLSQKKLADATGLSQSAIARWELNQVEADASDIITLAKFFGVTCDYILGVTDY